MIMLARISVVVSS